ncbi:MAG: PilZ domain-containing protein [Candidatus Sulfotelmatobacter sp.]
MSDENSAGASYLASLKRSLPQAAGTAAARAPIPSETGTGGAVSLEKQADSSEKRQSPRYHCQGSAYLRDVRSGVATWATFTDISLHGCYVEAMSTFRVGSPLTLTLEVNGFRVESKGEVKVVYPNLGMGISFTTMSEENREKLRELLGSLSRPSVILGPRASARPQPTPKPESLSAALNPAAVLKALTNFFEERQMLSRDEFLRILRKIQSSGV